MNAAEIRDIARRLYKLAAELDGIRASGDGSLHVTIPSSMPDLFAQLERGEIDGFEVVTDSDESETIKVTQSNTDHVKLDVAGVEADAYVVSPEAEPEPQTPAKRSYTPVGAKMEESVCVSISDKVRKADGFFQRSNLERTIKRTSGRSAKEVREAMNAAALELDLTSFKDRDGYRYYRISDRPQLEAATRARL